MLPAPSSSSTLSPSLIDKETKSAEARKYFEEVDANEIKFEQQMKENKEEDKNSIMKENREEEEKNSILPKELLDEEDYYLCEESLKDRDVSQSSGDWNEKEDEEGYIIIVKRD